MRALRNLTIETWARLAAGAGLLALAIVPTALVESLPPACIFQNVFGISCFGCGMTRGVACLLHGDLTAALSWHKAAPAAVAAAVMFIAFGTAPLRLLQRGGMGTRRQ